MLAMKCSKPAATKMATGPMITATLPDNVLANIAILSSFESIVAAAASPIVHAASDRHLFRCDGLDSIHYLISCYNRLWSDGGTWTDTGIPFRPPVAA